jgi:hypothetical protein
VPGTTGRAMTSVLSARPDPPEAHAWRSERTTLVSVLVPLEDHRRHAPRALRAWCAEQTLDRSSYEVIVAASHQTPEHELAAVRALLGERDRLVLTASRHDIGQVAQAATLAQGELLFFSESHVWPDPDVLERCVERMDEHPEWSALNCALKRVTHNRLGEVEANMYERDFAAGCTQARWRNILDASFCTRRAPYFAAGGFDGELGHFAEWVLAARYATEGFVVGNCPDIVMWHLYPGDLGALRAFTEDFTRGEIAYLGRNHAQRRETLIEAPLEWTRRGERRRDLAAHVMRVVIGETRRARAERRPATIGWRPALKRLPVAVFGGRLDHVASMVQLVTCYAVLLCTRRFGSLPALGIAFERYIAAVIRRTRLRCTDASLAPGRPAETGELWTPYPDMAANAAGLHHFEEFQGVRFCWSEPEAVVAVDLPPGRYRIHVHTLQAQLCEDACETPEFFFNAKPVPRDDVSADGDAIRFCVDVPPAENSRLAWICAPASAPGDERRLGLPLVSVLATLAV